MEIVYSSTTTFHNEFVQQVVAYAIISLKALCMATAGAMLALGWPILKENARRAKAWFLRHGQKTMLNEVCTDHTQLCKERDLHQAVLLQGTKDEIEGENFWNFDGDSVPLAHEKHYEDTTADEHSSLWSVAFHTSQGWGNLDLSEPHQAVGEGAKDPASAAIADASRALETAIASGDLQLIDSALASASRICSPSWLARACSHLRASGISLGAERTVEIAVIFGRERRGDLAVDLWYEQVASCLPDLVEVMADRDKTVPGEDLYSAALEACARCGDFQSAARAARIVQWRPPSSTSGQAAQLALARWLARQLCIEEALKCYRAVWQACGSPDQATHRAVLIASVRCADMMLASNLFQQFSANGLMPDSNSFSAMICGYCAAGNMEKAVQYFYMMLRCGNAPTTSLFNAMLDGCAWRNMPTLMERVLADMESAGVQPSSATLSILMKGYGQSYGIDQALALFEDMPRRYGLELDGNAYSTLISLCLQNDCFYTAWNVYERMSSSRCRLGSRTYEALISSCCCHGELNCAVRLVDDALVLSAEPVEHRPAAPLRLKSEVVEQLLQIIGRRQEAQRLGVPLLARLQRAGFIISEHLCEALLRHAQPGTEKRQLVLHQRRAEFHSWRKHVHGV